MIAPRPTRTLLASGSTPTDGGHEDRHGHGFGHAERYTADADGTSPALRHDVAPGVDRAMVDSGAGPAVVDRRPFCVAEPVTVTAYVTVGRKRGPSTRFVHADLRGP